MTDASRPPQRHATFRQRFPALGDAWSGIAEAGKEGPLDAATARLVKLAIAVGAQREGSVRASVRKAGDAGVATEQIDQVLRLAAGTIGLPAVAAAFGWIEDEQGKASSGDT